MTEKLIILSPGWGNSTWHMKPMEHRFRNEGFDVMTVTNDHRGIRESAINLGIIVQEAHKKYSHISFIGYSMGGIVGKYLIHKLPECNYLNSYISVSSPHQGTQTAGLAFWSKPAQEMRIDSPLLNDFKNVEWPLQIPALAIQAEYDKLVMPVENSFFNNAENIMIPKTTHLSVIMGSRAFHEINSWISSIFFPESFKEMPHEKGVGLTVR